MSSLTAQQLRKLLVKMKLLNSAQFDECLTRLGSSNRSIETLLQLMEAQNLLTSYQTTRIKKGETDRLVLGNYKLMYQNATGGFARVYRACSLKDGGMVGLKVLRRRWAKDPEEVVRFRKEAEVGKRLKHENIVPIYKIESRKNDAHFFTMEFVEGGNLRDLIKIRKKIPLTEATKWMIDMSEGLRYALERGFTHRDMKLTNVLMSIHQTAKLIDFGMAGKDRKYSGQGQRAIEYATLENGTNARQGDPRSDLFFLGAIYYHLLTGNSPFPRPKTKDEKMDISRYKGVRSVQLLEPDLPRTAADIVARMMELDPKRRYQAPIEVLSALKGLSIEIGNSRSEAPAKSAVPESKRADSQERSMATVMCIEHRAQKQDILRKYFSKWGFRVLVVSDIDRGMMRLKSNPPDCLILMGESIGDRTNEAYRAAIHQAARKTAVFVILDKNQVIPGQLYEESDFAKVLFLPITMKELRKHLQSALDTKSSRS